MLQKLSTYLDELHVAGGRLINRSTVAKDSLSMFSCLTGSSLLTILRMIGSQDGVVLVADDERSTATRWSREGHDRQVVMDSWCGCAFSGG
ncbi:hypothetical protein CLAIMM_06928 [Cladophialophora immunda]|nr:hypothetical protein CLAIMM_06928 [Cladophialophora immunda]